jgi:hypothetical protein
MNAEAIAKLSKAVILVAGIGGYTIAPEQIDAILEGAAALMSVIYGYEAYRKSKAGQPKG